MSPKIKILATGAGGMLGGDVIKELSEKFEVFPTDLPELDVQNKEAINRWMEKIKPDYVLHMAAITDLDLCEENPELADAVNHIGTLNVAEACEKTGTSIIYISTSGIFSGRKKSPYSENDKPIPQNAYGKTKYLGELAVEKTLPSECRLILRAGWLFGGGKKDIKFVGKIYKLVHRLDKLTAVNDIYGSPNYSVDIGKLIDYLIRNKVNGIYHASNEGCVTRFDIAEEIVRLAGVDCRVEPVPATDFPTRAPRPPMEAMTNKKLEKLGYKMRGWKEALAEYIDRLKCELEY